MREAADRLVEAAAPAAHGRAAPRGACYFDGSLRWALISLVISNIVT